MAMRRAADESDKSSTPPMYKNGCNRILVLLSVAMLCAASGCSFLPDVRQKPQFHNPFPQVRTVAVLPFRNQSESPTLSGERVSLAYSHELQGIPGFEVLPIGAVRNQLIFFEQQYLKRPISMPGDFQQFAQHLGVDAVIQGSIVDFEPYYPPRMSLKTNWYTANPNFHAVPVGYGLPWGTKDEKQIPEWVRLEAERELATEQMVSQTPVETHVAEVSNESVKDSLAKVSSDTSVKLAANTEKRPEPPVGTSVAPAAKSDDAQQANHVQIVWREIHSSNETNEANSTDATVPSNDAPQKHAPLPKSPTSNPASINQGEHSLVEGVLPSAAPTIQWPDPEGFIPPVPSETPPQAIKFAGPVISHMATYNGANEDFTSELEDYYYFRDDGRFGGWEAYLQRSEDFIRFCCYLHIKETLVGRGGQLKNRTVVRWPISRYEDR